MVLAYKEALAEVEILRTAAAEYRCAPAEDALKEQVELETVQLENIQLRSALRKLGENASAADLAQHYEEQLQIAQQEVWRLQDDCARLEASENRAPPRVLQELQNEVAHARAVKTEKGKQER